MLEEPVCLLGWCGGQPEDVGVEVFEDRAPHAVDGAVAFVDDHQVE